MTLFGFDCMRKSYAYGAWKMLQQISNSHDYYLYQNGNLICSGRCLPDIKVAKGNFSIEKKCDGEWGEVLGGMSKAVSDGAWGMVGAFYDSKCEYRMLMGDKAIEKCRFGKLM